MMSDGGSGTRMRMIEATERLLQRHGYAATSWRRVVEAARTPWGSAHHHFPGGKEQLAAEALALGGAHVTELLRGCLSNADTAGEAVRAWFATSARLLRASGYRDGCPVATVALETAPQSDVLTAACGDAFSEWEALLAARLRASGVPSVRSRTLATVAVSSLEGALILARVRKKTTPLTHAGAAMGDLFDAATATTIGH